jgi:hypothetical protein
VGWRSRRAERDSRTPKMLGELSRASPRRSAMKLATALACSLWLASAWPCRSEGALAAGEYGIGGLTWAYAQNRGTRTEASADALEQCNASGKAACTIRAQFRNACIALAVQASPYHNGSAVVTHPDISFAEQAAVLRCNSMGTPCTVRQSFCDGVNEAEATPLPVPSGPPKYSIAGIELGTSFGRGHSRYSDFRCQDSEQFEGFTWCSTHDTGTSARGKYATSTSVMRGPDGTVVYVNHYVSPAFFDGADFDKEIDRLSRRFSGAPKIVRAPRRDGLSAAVIARWGAVEFEPLDDASTARLATGERVDKGVLVDFVGSWVRSNKLGLPIYRVRGGPGYAWAASYDDSGRGHLRFLASDAGRFESAPRVARAPPPPAPSRNGVPVQQTGSVSPKTVPPPQVGPTPVPHLPQTPSAPTAQVPGPQLPTPPASMPTIPAACPARSVDYPERLSLLQSRANVFQEQVRQWTSVREKLEKEDRVNPDAICKTHLLSVQKMLDDIGRFARSSNDAYTFEKFGTCIDDQLKKIEVETKRLQGKRDPVGVILRGNDALVRNKISAGMLAREYAQMRGSLEATKDWLKSAYTRCNI